MASTRRGRIGRRIDKTPRPPLRVLTAAATTIDMSDRVETRRERALRQGWQILAWCVDEDTEILTTRGWLRHDDVRDGDVALTLDHETGLSTWQPIESIQRFESIARPMLSMEGRLHSSLTTLDHRWPVVQRRAAWTASDVARRRARRHGAVEPDTDARPAPSITREWRTSETLTVEHSIITGAPCADLPTEAKYDDAFVEAVAWWWTEGYSRPGGYSTITQSHEKHPEYVARIRAALTRAFGVGVATTRGVDGPAWRESQDRSCTVFALNAAAGRTLLAIAGPDKAVRPDFILSLTRAQLELFVQTSIDADGNRHRGRNVRITQSVRARLDSFMLAVILTGRTPHLYEKHPGCWALHLRDRTTTSPHRAATNGHRGATTVREVRHEGTVWCPVTQNRTWLARRNGTVYFTGNTYRDSIGEFRYAVNFLANCTSRMRLYPAMYPEGGESDVPVALDNENCPPEVKAACEQALRDLGNGRMAISQLLHTLSSSWSTVGECFLVGQEDPMTMRQTWRIRSNQEIIIYNDEWKLREVPMDPQGILGWVTLDPDDTYIARLWQPHPEFHVLADCPTRALISDMESLQILRRMIRATGRSRLASRGVLAIPNEFSISQPIDDNLDPTADSFMDDFARAVTTPLSEEGTAAEVVPVVMRGPADAIKDIRWIEFASQFDALSKETRAELVGIIATGLDLPKEVITGIADLNHWSAWQVDDNTFRHHVEPHVISCIDALTGGYLRPYLRNSGLPEALVDEWAERVLFWYDPTELVTHPDQTADALQLHDRGVISNTALRRTAGFSEEDAPTADEFLAWLISKQRTWPANVSEAVIHSLSPTLQVPAITGPGIIPGIDPVRGVFAPDAPAAPPSSPGGATPPADASGPIGGDTGAPPAVPGPPPISDTAVDAHIAALAIADDDPTVTLLWAMRGLAAARLADQQALPVLVAAAPRLSARDRRLSQRLAKIDADLRLRIVTAADAAMTRVLEKAGSRIANKVRRDETMRTAIRHSRLSEVGQVLGREAVTAAGLDPDTLVPPEAFDDLLAQFAGWTSEAQRQAVATACQLVNIDPEGAEAIAARAHLSSKIGQGAAVLRTALQKLAANLLYDPDPAVESAAHEALDGARTLVPTGTVRAALGVTAGYNEQQVGTIALKDGTTVPGIALGAPIAQVSTSATISDLLTSNGATGTGYEWIHGASDRPFDPHEELDGVEFATFDDPALANAGDFPDNDFFFPGDHNGCSCDYLPLWATGIDTGPDVSSNEGDEAAEPSASEG